MKNKNLNIEIEKYLNSNWNQILDDISSLVSIPSSKNDGKFNKTFPNGTGACNAMKQALSISKRMGFTTKNHKNMIGIADYQGISKTQIGIIGHCDVVPPGTGWHFDPYKLNIVNDYLIGRGVLDDKGPTVIFLHAINFWLQKEKKLPYSIRFLFGTDEETFSTDVTEYLKHYEEPRFVLTPDSDFPVPYGETGIIRFTVSQKINNGEFISIKAGDTNNAVAGKAIAKIDGLNRWIDTENFRLAHAIKINRLENGNLEIIAKGRASHAAEPFNGIDSVAVLSQFCLEKNIGNAEEQVFMKFLSKIAGRPHGEGVGMNWKDEHFKDLTIVPTLLRYENGEISQDFDIRCPKSETPEKVKKQITKHMPRGAKYTEISAFPAYLVNPKSKLIRSMQKSYKQATGEEPKLFTMGGGTYAKCFRCGVSFGPIRNWIPKPAWVGNIHGPDEGISIDEMKTAFSIYVHAIINFMELDLDDPNFINETMGNS